MHGQLSSCSARFLGNMRFERKASSEEQFLRTIADISSCPGDFWVLRWCKTFPTSLAMEEIGVILDTFTSRNEGTDKLLCGERVKLFENCFSNSSAFSLETRVLTDAFGRAIYCCWDRREPYLSAGFNSKPGCTKLPVSNGKPI